MFRNCVRQNVSLVEASSMGMSIFEYAPKSKGAECYRDVAHELLEKLKGRGKREEPVRPASAAEPVHEPVSVELEKAPEPEPEPVSVSEPEPVRVSEPEPEPEELDVASLEGLVEINPEEPEPVTEEPVKPEPVYATRTLGDYEEGIKRSVLEMLPEKRRPMWKQILGSVSSISRDEIDAHMLQEDFDGCDKERYKFYVLNDERDSFWQVMYSDQIIDPMRCVMKFDEYDGSAEVYI